MSSRIDVEALHVVVLVLHLLVAEEGRVLALGHADGVEQVAVGGDVHRLHRREGRQHHLHFGGFEDPRVVLHVAVVHLDVGLGEEAEDLRQQVPLRLAQLVAPVLDVVGQRHLFRQPVDTLLDVPGVVGPGIVERLVDGLGVEQGHGGGRYGRSAVNRTAPPSLSREAAARPKGNGASLAGEAFVVGVAVGLGGDGGQRQFRGGGGAGLLVVGGHRDRGTGDVRRHRLRALDAQRAAVETSSRHASRPSCGSDGGRACARRRAGRC